MVCVMDESYASAADAYMSKAGFAGIQLVLVPTQQLADANLLATPSTVVVDDVGRVKRAWMGMWSEEEVRQVEKYFDLEPGGLPVPPPLGV